MHWGCFSRQGVGPLVPLEGSVMGISHVETLHKYVLPTLNHVFPLGDAWFQEDNTRPHKAKVAEKFCEENWLFTLPWPAQSPDLNLIENLWAVAKRCHQKQCKKPSNLAQLERMVQKVWKAIPKSIIENFGGIPCRIG
jgi:hypothetical protein